MEKSDIKELKNISKIDKRHIIQFMDAYGFKVKGKVKLYFYSGFDTDLIEPKVDDLRFKNLWQLTFEPELVFTQFSIEFPTKLDRNEFVWVLQNLTNKISHRAWPTESYENTGYLDEFTSVCPHFQRIVVSTPKKLIVIKIYAGICYHC